MTIAFFACQGGQTIWSHLDQRQLEQKCPTSDLPPTFLMFDIFSLIFIIWLKLSWQNPIQKTGFWPRICWMDFEAKKFAGENLAFSILCRNRHAPRNSIPM